MKKTKKQLANQNVIFTFLFFISCLFSVAQEKKNRITLSTGISISNIKESDNNNLGGNGSNLFFSYGRQIKKVGKGYFTLEGKISSMTNPYVTDFASNGFNSDTDLTSITGNWTGSSDKFKSTSYLLGFGFYRYLSSNQKLSLFAKIYAGSGTLVSPVQTYTSENGYVLSTNEVKSSSFAYSYEAGLCYDISKSISLGVGLAYFKSSFDVENQKLTLLYLGANNSQDIPSYELDYSNLNLNAELIFKF